MALGWLGQRRIVTRWWNAWVTLFMTLMLGVTSNAAALATKTLQHSAPIADGIELSASYRRVSLNHDISLTQLAMFDT